MPSELEELDRELSAIEIEERPSFGPELKAELERAYHERARRRWLSLPRMAAVASVAALLLASVSVPGARGSLVRFFRTVKEEAVELLRPPPPPVSLPEVVVEERPQVEPEEDVVTEIEFAAPDVDVPDFEPPPVPTSEIAVDMSAAFPEILDRRATRRHIESLYPDTLQEMGIGGVVELVLWVSETGEVDWVQYVATSGVPELDRAAILAAPSLRFRPARRNGVAVGTWVKFDVRFVPPPDLPGRIPGDTTVAGT